MTTSLTIKINSTDYSAYIVDKSFSLSDKIEERSTCGFTLYDANGAYSFKKGQSVTVTDTLEGTIFSGIIQGVKRTSNVWPQIYHDITCTDKVAIIDGKTSDKQYTNQYAGAIAVDQLKDEWSSGITANYAIDADDSQADFAAGTLSGTVAASNVGNGDLELALAGSQVTILEDTTSVFGSGTLTNMTASSNALAPTASSALKIQATQSGVGIANTYTYVKIYSSGSISIVSGRYLAYDIWISSSSPEAKIGVDITFTDNTSLRDLATNTFDKYYDAQNKSPHPGTDLSGLATDQWYHRKFSLDEVSGKTIAYVTVAIEGDKQGTYTGYIKNIYETDASDNIINTFFNGSLLIYPPQQMQKQGYGTTSVSVVDTYDCSTASRVSPSYSISPVNLLKSSFLTYTTSLPTGYTFNLSYSIDAGATYTSITTNNTSLPNLLAGQSLSGKSIQFKQSFTQGSGASPEKQSALDSSGNPQPQLPQLTSLQLVLDPSYTATKSDVSASFATNAQWGATGTSFSNTQATSNMIMPFGAVRNWDDGDFSGQTLYGGAATGPNTDTSCRQYVDTKQFRIFAYQSTETRSRLDIAGQWADFQMEFDVYIDNSVMKPGCVYRTTGWSNYDANYAYAVEIFGTTVALQRGSNSSAASAGTRTQVASATINLTSQAIHRVKVIASGSSHQIYIDDVQVINATDGTYTSAGYVGFRISNGDSANGYIGLFDNWGISPTSLGGSWTSQSISLSGASTYGGSVVQWLDASTDPSQVSNTVQSSIDGGSTWQTLTNGGAIQNLTSGQSLSSVSVKFKVSFSANSSTVLPKMQYLTAYILGGFSSSGTRINKALLLSDVGTCGSTLVFWNSVTPANTSVTVATSLDGTSYTTITSGGSITGLTQQPAPTIDTFNLISANDYTSTSRTGGTATSWIWDTANSRLSVSGGTNALLLYAALSQKDADVYFDIDQADQGGIVWRRSDNSNFYELDIFDASSSAGAANIMRLYKVVANVKTQIGSDIAITLARGSIVKRARVTMIGTAITVYFDGSQVLSTTDSSLAGPGQIGFINVSGSAQFYNLRIQPQGDNLSGKQVYVKQTLTSTDPTQTPQITDITTLVTNPNIAAGSLVLTANYVDTYKSDNIKDLAKQSDYYWNINSAGSFIFLPRETTPAPWILTNQDILSMDVEDSADLYRNRQTLTGVFDQLNVEETKIGDGKSTSWTLQYNVVSMSSITLNGQDKTFGQKGIDTGKDLYYEVGSNSLAQDSSGTLLVSTDSLVVSYTGDYETSVTRNNTGQFAGTISQRDYINQSGLSIPTQTILNQASAAHTASGNSDDLDVSLVRSIALDINISAVSGSSPSLQFIVERKDAAGNYYAIYTSSAITTTTTLSRTIGQLGQTKEALGVTCRIRWTITGSSPSFTFSISILGHVDPQLAGIGVVEAVEDVSSQKLTKDAANTFADARLQQDGKIGRIFKFKTKRTGLAVGQYLSVFLSNVGIQDASMLITSVQRNQQFKMTGGTQDMTYIFDIEAVEGAVLTSWAHTLNNALA